MKKLLFLAAIIAACVVSMANATAKSVNDAASVNSAAAVAASELYVGQAYDLVMAGRPIPGSYYAEFNIDRETGDIVGDFEVEPAIHDFYLE